MLSDTFLHATAVAHGARGLLIFGASGSGKSSLALQLMSFGARLVADDQVCVEYLPDGPPRLSAPDHLHGKIEARGVGILGVEAAPAYATLAVTLAEVETERLPPLRHYRLGDHDIPLLRKVESPAFPSILWHCLTGERTDP